jgi:hypothetical protein
MGSGFGVRHLRVVVSWIRAGIRFPDARFGRTEHRPGSSVDRIETMGDAATEREDRLRLLASRLFFTLEHKGSRYELYRDADVERPVRHEGLTLDEVEKILNLWKLRGPHGG